MSDMLLRRQIDFALHTNAMLLLDSSLKRLWRSYGLSWMT